MGLFNRSKDKKTKDINEEIEQKRAAVLSALNACIVTFEEYAEGEEGTEERLRYDKALNTLKLSYKAIKDITVKGDWAELAYLDEITKHIDAVNESMYDGVGVTYQDGTYREGRKGMAVKGVYSVTWNWLHL